jgi:broad specificity phosphatase PhoE
MNFDFRRLSNTYFVMRHGRSLANEKEIIVSDPAKGVSGYGLTEQGKLDVAKSVNEAKENNILDASTIIISSDFTRATETANIAAKILGAKDAVLTPKLRERYFGQLEATHNSNYQMVWDEDVVDHTHTTNSVESVADVLARGLSLISELEEKYVSRNILLVSHGDTLQILQTAFKDTHPSKHRSLVHLKTAEIRALH